MMFGRDKIDENEDKGGKIGRTNKKSRPPYALADRGLDGGHGRVIMGLKDLIEITDTNRCNSKNLDMWPSAFPGGLGAPQDGSSL